MPHGGRITGHRAIAPKLTTGPPAQAATAALAAVSALLPVSRAAMAARPTRLAMVSSMVCWRARNSTSFPSTLRRRSSHGRARRRPRCTHPQDHLCVCSKVTESRHHCHRASPRLWASTPGEPKEFLKIEKLNSKLDSYEYSLQGFAFQGIGLRARARSELEKAGRSSPPSVSTRVLWTDPGGKAYRRAEQRHDKQIELQLVRSAHPAHRRGR